MTILKSISSLFLFTTFVFSMNRHNKMDKFAYLKDGGYIKEFNFDYYLNMLEKAVEFCMCHKHYVDLNLAFGLFLVDVNLRTHVQEERYAIPKKRRYRLKTILLKTEFLLDYFHDMVKKSNTHDSIYKHFYNKTTWPRAPDKFNSELRRITKLSAPIDLSAIYGTWKSYATDVDNLGEFIPSVSESDKCIGLLAQNVRSRSPATCRIPSHCKKILHSGSDFGYALSHRILFLILARFSRQCTVFSEHEDKQKTDEFCFWSYHELQFIEGHGFRLPDLMFENIALCGLLGHDQFMRRHWFGELRRFQTSEGCFMDSKPTGEFIESSLREGDQWVFENRNNIKKGQCNGHFTAVAAAALATALRYIIETFY